MLIEFLSRFVFVVASKSQRFIVERSPEACGSQWVCNGIEYTEIADKQITGSDRHTYHVTKFTSRTCF